MADMKLPKIAFGAWAWGNDGTFGRNLSERDLRPVYDAAMRRGLNLWDTAFVYGMGTSERVLGEFVKDTPREKVLVSTKFTPQCADSSADNAVAAMFESSQKLLNTDFIDIYWIHNPVGAPEWTRKLVEVAKKGSIGMIGVSNHNLAEIKQAKEILEDAGLKLSAVQNHYSLLNRSSEHSGILEYCRENDITFFSYMVLEQGVLTGRYGSRNPLPEGSDRAAAYNPVLPQIEQLNDRLKEIADGHGVGLAQIPIAWAIAKGTLPIIGVTRPEQVEDAAKAISVALTAEEIQHMEELADSANINTIRGWEKEMK